MNTLKTYLIQKICEIMQIKKTLLWIVVCAIGLLSNNSAFAACTDQEAVNAFQQYYFSTRGKLENGTIPVSDGYLAPAAPLSVCSHTIAVAYNASSQMLAAIIDRSPVAPFPVSEYEQAFASLSPNTFNYDSLSSGGKIIWTGVREKLGITGATTTCQSPQVLQNGVCVTPTPTCQAPQVLQNGTCVTPTPTCQAPQVLQNGACVTPTPTCQAPQVLQNGACVTPTPTCQSPQVLQNGVCVTPTPTCQTPQVLQNGACVTPNNTLNELPSTFDGKTGILHLADVLLANVHYSVNFKLTQPGKFELIDIANITEISSAPILFDAVNNTMEVPKVLILDTDQNVSGILGYKGHADNDRTKFNFEIINPKSCNETQATGSGSDLEGRVIELNKTSGTFNLSWNTYTVPDNLYVFYENKIIYSTGCVSNTGSAPPIQYSGNSSKVTIRVEGSCQGSQLSTDWSYTPSCP